MVLGHPPPIIARGREDAPQGGCEGLTPVHVPRVGEALGARHSRVQETLAEPLAVVQDIPPAGPPTFPRLTGPTRAVGGTPSLRARALVDRPMGLVGRRAMGDGVGIGAARRPALHLGGNSVRLNFCMVAELSDATVRDGRSTPFHWPNRSGRNRASHRCVWSAPARPTG
jgi:hypothetical protein